jgi:hypothetical protein
MDLETGVGVRDGELKWKAAAGEMACTLSPEPNTHERQMRHRVAVVSEAPDNITVDAGEKFVKVLSVEGGCLTSMKVAKLAFE